MLHAITLRHYATTLRHYMLIAMPRHCCRHDTRALRHKTYYAIRDIAGCRQDAITTLLLILHTLLHKDSYQHMPHTLAMSH